jgi:hypothetical protein
MVLVRILMSKSGFEDEVLIKLLVVGSSSTMLWAGTRVR